MKFNKYDPKSVCIIDGDCVACRIAYAIPEDKIETEDSLRKSISDTLLAICNTVGAAKSEIHMTTLEKDYYRYKIAVTPGPNGVGYKAQRSSRPRPKYYTVIRNILIAEHLALVAVNMEADDSIMIRATQIGEDHAIIAGDDKDYHTFRGAIYNIRTGVLDKPVDLPEVGRLELAVNGKKKKLVGRGVIWFYAQMLMGDTADNIPGLPGIGDVKAYSILKDCEDEYACFCTIVKQYRDILENDFNDEEMAQRIIEIGSLLWIQQWESINRMAEWTIALHNIDAKRGIT